MVTHGPSVVTRGPSVVTRGHPWSLVVHPWSSVVTRGPLVCTFRTDLSVRHISSFRGIYKINVSGIPTENCPARKKFI